MDDMPPPDEGCDRLRVTAYVDGALAPAERETLEVHLAACARCRDQASVEQTLASAVRTLPPPPLPHGLAARVRRRSRKPQALRRRVWVPALAAMVLLLLWAHVSSSAVSWQLALDHAHCFGKRRLPAEILTGDPVRLSAWFSARGTDLPLVPASAGGLDLIGGRFCRLADRTVAHVYYAGERHNLSLYVVPGPLLLDRSFVWSGSGSTVNLMQVGGANVGLVSDDQGSLGAVRRSLKRTIASGRGALPAERDAPGAGEDPRMYGVRLPRQAEIGEAVRVADGDGQHLEPPLDVRADPEVEAGQQVADVALEYVRARR
jgi:anti-sigma factor RsiW